MFDDGFDVQHLAKDLQPVWNTTTNPPIIAQSGIGNVLRTPDILYPYDLFPTAGFSPVITLLDVAMCLIAKLGYEEIDPLPGTVQSICDDWKIEYVTQFTYNSDKAQLDSPFSDVAFQSRAFLFRYITNANTHSHRRTLAIRLTILANWLPLGI